MKNHIVIATTILALLGSSAAMADPRDNQWDNRQQSQSRNDHYDNGRRGNDRYDNDRRGNDHYDNGRRDYGRQWKRGQHVDRRYLNNGYVVSDYRGHHLNRPPRGYQWVHDDDNNFLLVAIASGVIASIILNSGR